MKPRFSLVLIGMFVVLPTILLVSIGKTQAAVFCVDDTSDGAPNAADCDANCTDGSNNCSLRDALTANENNNNDPAQDTIIFNIPDTDPNCAGGPPPICTIFPTTEYDVNEPIFINGYSQPNASPNTLSNGNDAVLLIELDGSSIAFASAGGLLNIDAGNSRVAGLVINRYINGPVIGAGIRLNTNGGNVIDGNFLGTDPTGLIDEGNGTYAVLIAGGDNNVIGGTTPAARNILSGNDFDGIRSGSTGNTVQGNFIGTDATGATCLRNEQNGIRLTNSGNNIIGGTAIGAGNVISCNGQRGIFLSNAGTTGNQIQGNIIGTDFSGTIDLDNALMGIGNENGAFGNTIGGLASGAGNTIAFNGGDGVLVSSGTNVAILGNSIYSNTLLGINLSPGGVTPNDAGDGDVGANNLQNFPVLTSAVSANGTTTIQGDLDSPGASFHYEFFSNDACDGTNGEGQTFLGAADLPSGNFNVVLPTILTNQAVITATATNNATNETSEFSACIVATILVENCTNTVDDDGDALADCADPDCASDAACAPTGAEVCNNDVDDDGDGQVDCDDLDCVASSLCGGFAEFSGSGCSLRSAPNSKIDFPYLVVFLLALGGMGYWRMSHRSNQ